jgi:hypothetical protein
MSAGGSLDQCGRVKNSSFIHSFGESFQLGTSGRRRRGRGREGSGAESYPKLRAKLMTNLIYSSFSLEVN